MLRDASWDDRRHLTIPGDEKQTLLFCVQHFIALAQSAIDERSAFYVALSGGSTPKALLHALCQPHFSKMLDWSKMHLFWSDERATIPTSPESNYRMAMDAGLSKMGIPSHQIHRMCAEENIEENARAYELLLPEAFDLVMLGMGEDGHTASLFPQTEALSELNRQVVANFIPQKNCWRMTFTYPCIDRAHHTIVYAIGGSKKEMLHKVLEDRMETYPASRVGTLKRKALWIADKAAFF